MRSMLWKMCLILWDTNMSCYCINIFNIYHIK